MRAAALLLGVTLAACSPGSVGGGGGGGDGRDGGMTTELDAAPPVGDLDKTAAREKYQTSTDLMRFIFGPGCSAETNECHSNEDFPDMSTQGNLMNLVMMQCNQGVGERSTIDDYCESLGDTLRITSGANDGFTSVIGSITLVNGTDGDFSHFEIVLETPTPTSQTGASFEFVRNGQTLAALGGGASLESTSGLATVRVTNANHIPDPLAVLQGDENKNGIFGDGTGYLVSPGDARGSYMVRRLLGVETTRIRMPLNENADNPTELNRNLSREEMYAIMSWINCMVPGDDVYGSIKYDCPENANNEGAW